MVYRAKATVLLLLLAGCGSDGKAVGTEGGACYEGACNLGLMCVDDVCVEDPDFWRRSPDGRGLDTTVPVDGYVPDAVSTSDSLPDVTTMPDNTQPDLPTETVVPADVSGGPDLLQDTVDDTVGMVDVEPTDAGDAGEIPADVVEPDDLSPGDWSEADVSCQPNCGGKECGSDGCGGSCGSCPGEQDECVGGLCVCQPDCAGKVCGSDGCGGSCGSCPGEQDECVGGTCVCQPDCAGKVCGSDGCGGSCGSCSGYQVCADFGASCKTPVDTGDYRVGVDYHSTGADFSESAFLSQYHNAAVRSTVLDQLQGMADAGADVIFTRLWMVNEAGTVPPQAYRWNFPPTVQQLENLRQYVQDVATITGPGGKPLELDLCLLYLWCAEYTEGSPDTTLGMCDMDPASYDAALQQTFSGVIEAVAGIYRPDGQHAVALLYMEGEVMTASDDADPATQWEKDNQRWFLETYYPAFTQQVRAAGMIPSLYFLTAPSEEQALDNDFTDSYLPVLNGRRSVYWIYRSLKFMVDHGLPVPERIDFSLYPNPPFAVSNDVTVVNRVFDDLEAALGALLPGPLRYGVAETLYYADPEKRHRLGKGFAAERALRGDNPEVVSFWTTPYNNGQTEPSGFPFDIDAFRGDDLDYPLAAQNPSFESVAPGTGRPVGWELAWANGNVSNWSVAASGAGPVDGSQALRLQSGTCAGCSGDWDGVWVRSDAVPVTPGEMAVVRFYERHSVTPVGTFPSNAFSGPIASLLGYTTDGQEKVLNQLGMHNGYWNWHRNVLLTRIPDDVVEVALRFALLKAWDKTLDLDLVH